MFRTWLLFVTATCGLVAVSAAGDIGPGEWNVVYIKKCVNDAHIFKFDVTQKKVNRTHDGFNADLILDEDFSGDFGVRIDIYKLVDGGHKQYQVLSDDSFVNFVNKYAENNCKVALEIAGVDPPEFPILAGEYHVRNYCFDYTELPGEGPYGEYIAKAFIMRGTIEVGCIEASVEFKEAEDDYDD